ncbi:hypothetical protein MKW94_029234 [Papaver nudicaule]|uniref:Aminotransferase-like plant mobile domain-containing protein n=1 Tax=Papaver nudicaule TaxID=74823 RepID=A0AA41RW79_PAPNU|nr:hypothetical protein [Papaver nudicaule]
MDVFIPTPEDIALLFGFQLIENGIEDKLTDTRKVNILNNDLCEKYLLGDSTPPVLRSTDVQDAILTAIRNGEVEDVVRLIVLYMCQTVFFSKTGNFNIPCSFLVYVESLDVINRISWPHLIHKTMMESIKSSEGNVYKITGCSFFLLYWFAERCSLNERRVDAETITPRFARWDTLKISKSISGLKRFPLTKSEAEGINLRHDLISEVEEGFEKQIITPVRQISRLERMKARVAELEQENSGLVFLLDESKMKMHESKMKMHEIQLKLRIEKNRLRALGKLQKRDVTMEILQLMDTTFDQIFEYFLEDERKDHNQEQVQEEQPTGGGSPQVDNDRPTGGGSPQVDNEQTTPGVGKEVPLDNVQEG